MTQETKLGLFVLLGIFSLVVSILLLGDFQLQRTYNLNILFNDIAGLPEKASVKIAGVQVGAVKRITLDGNKARVTVWIRQGIEIHRDADARIVSTGVIGSKYLELTSGTQSAPVLKDKDLITGIDPLSFDKIITQTMEQIGSLVSAFKGDGNGSIGDNLNETLSNLRDVSEALKSALADQEDKLVNIVGNVDKFTGDMADITSENKEDVRAAIKGIRATSEKLDRLLAKLESGEGTIGKLINDDDMGKDLKTTVKELKETSIQARRVMKRMNLIETDWSYNVRYDVKEEKIRNDLGLKIIPREGKYYYIGGSNLGDNSASTTPDTQQRNTLDVLLGGDFGPVELYGGAIRSKGGAGMKVRPGWKWDPWRRLELTAEAYDFSRETPVKKAKVNAGARVQVARWAYLGAQYEDLYADSNLNASFNVVLRDDDIAYLLGLVGLASR